MKKLFMTLMLLPLLGLAQTIENIDYISPFHDGVAAIKKGNEWGFIDLDGKIIIDFRDDLLLTKKDDTSYPIFSNERCLITLQKEGVLYYGYIDKTGKTIITPQFLNAANFEGNKALALKVEKETIGYNHIFKKDVVSYHYFEVVIDMEGKPIEHLTQLAIHVSPKDKNDKNPPIISSRLISDKLIAIKESNSKWRIKKID
ncbi:WG repeat-containing protein [Yeosuana marina]|uniref:WG repeat-containing protein n=1 Tax=Yeosuana marina TaxID=1565536 RepID=UPI0030C8BC3B